MRSSLSLGPGPGKGTHLSGYQPHRRLQYPQYTTVGSWGILVALPHCPVGPCAIYLQITAMCEPGLGVLTSWPYFLVLPLPGPGSKGIQSPFTTVNRQGGDSSQCSLESLYHQDNFGNLSEPHFLLW